MELPNGKIVKRVELMHTSLESVFKALEDKSFTGYIAICCHGKTGLEEGLIFFDSGKGMGTHYKYLKLEKEVDGEPAFARCVNAAKAKAVVLDLIKLTPEEVQGVLASNATILFVCTHQSIKKHEKKEFSDEFEEEMHNLAKKKRSELMQKYRLNTSISLVPKKKQIVKQEQSNKEVIAEKIVDEEKGRINVPALKEE